ncbi:MAG TPA: hypothetical protein VGK67_24920 [Myxococcales bacterium]
MRRALLPAVLCTLAILAVPATASAAGPVVQGGLVKTELANSGNLRMGNLNGGAYKIGFEVGSHRWRSEWAFNQTLLNGYSYATSGDHKLTLTGFSYQLSFLFRETGFSPYVGLGAEMGLASLQESGWAYNYAYSYSETSDGGYIRPYGILGLRMQFGFGLALRGEVSASYYGDFVSMNTALGISYTW